MLYPLSYIRAPDTRKFYHTDHALSMMALRADTHSRLPFAGLRCYTKAGSCEIMHKVC